MNSENEIHCKNANIFIQDVIENTSPKITPAIKDAYYVFNDYAALKRSLKSVGTEAFSMGIVANGFDSLTR